MTTFALLVALLGQTPAQAPVKEKPALFSAWSGPAIVITARGSNGELRGSTTTAGAGVWYAYAAASPCTTVISPTMPATAGFAWQVEIAVESTAGDPAANAVTPPADPRRSFLRFSRSNGEPASFFQYGRVANAPPVTLKVTWQRRFEDGARKDGPPRTVQLSLRPGASVMLDYLSATPTDACNAVGLSLEIGTAPVRSTATIETDLWLKHRLPDGREQTQRQTLRSRLGSSGADYFFDDITVATARGEVVVEISGRISPFDQGPQADGGELQMNIEIQRQYSTTSKQIGWKTRSGGTDYSLRAKPGEVLTFILPSLDGDDVLAGHKFSMFLRPAQLKSLSQ